MEYVNQGYTGRVKEGRVIVHSPDGHLMMNRQTEIATIEGLKMLIDYICEVA